MLELNLQNSYGKSIGALAKSLTICFVVLLSLQQSVAQSPLNAWRSSGPKATVFREGTWLIRQCTNGISIQNFGLVNDKPVPAAYLP